MKIIVDAMGGDNAPLEIVKGALYAAKARPELEIILVGREEEVRNAARECGAAAPAVPVKDTVKRAKDGLVSATLERSELFAVQTPQVFEPSLLKAALSKALEDGAELTDDCAAVERLGIGVALTQGEYRNLKITTPEDMAVAEALLAQWDEA